MYLKQDDKPVKNKNVEVLKKKPRVRKKSIPPSIRRNVSTETKKEDSNNKK